MRLLLPLPASAKDIKKMASLLDGRESDWVTRVSGCVFDGKSYLAFDVDRDRIKRTERVKATKVDA